MIRILIVDDDTDLRNTLCDAFIAFGHTVSSAENGLQALELFKKGQFDVGIFDVELPEMNGFQLTKEVKKINGDFPVILITGYSHLYRPQDVFKLNVEAFLRKPINISELVSIINQIISQKKSI